MKRKPCSTRACKRPPAVAGMCKTHATRLADRLFSEKIRGIGFCEVASWLPSVKCAGYLQTMHVISRRYHAIRWDRTNALAGCAAHHKFYTEHPLEWERDCVANGIDYPNLCYLALHDPVPDLDDVLAELGMS